MPVLVIKRYFMYLKAFRCPADKVTQLAASYEKLTLNLRHVVIWYFAVQIHACWTLGFYNDVTPNKAVRSASQPVVRGAYNKTLLTTSGLYDIACKAFIGGYGVYLVI
jgi:hypothetical protein